MRQLVERADLCLALGTRFSQETTANWTLPIPAALVHVDLDAGRFGRTYPPGRGDRLGRRPLLPGAPRRRREPRLARRRGGGAGGAPGARLGGRRSGRARRGGADARAPRGAARGRDRDRRHDRRGLLGGALPRRQAARLVRLPGVGRPGMRRPARARHGRRAPRSPDGRDRRRRRLPDGRPRAPHRARRGPGVRHARRERLRVRDPAELPGDDVRPHGRRRAERARLRRPRRGVRRALCGGGRRGRSRGGAWRGAGRSDRAGARRAPARRSKHPGSRCNQRGGTQGSPASPLLKAGVASSALRRRARSSPSHDGLAHAEASGPDPTGSQLFHTPHHGVRQAATLRRRYKWRHEGPRAHRLLDDRQPGLRAARRGARGGLLDRGRRRAPVPRRVRRRDGDAARPLPSAGRRGAPRAGRRAHVHVPLLVPERADARPGRADRAGRAGRPRVVLLQLVGLRGERVGAAPRGALLGALRARPARSSSCRA